MALDNIVVACTALCGRLVIARRGKDRGTIGESRDAEAEIMCAVCEFMMRGSPNGASKSVSFDGGKAWFQISVRPCEVPAAAVANWAALTDPAIPAQAE